MHDRRYALAREIRLLFEEGFILPPATYKWPKTLICTLDAEGTIIAKIVLPQLKYFSEMQLDPYEHYDSGMLKRFDNALQQSLGRSKLWRKKNDIQ